MTTSFAEGDAATQRNARLRETPDASANRRLLDALRRILAQTPP